MKTICGLLAILGLAGTAGAQSVFYDFNSGAADFTSHFIERGFGTATYFSTGGVSNSGAIRGPGANSSAEIHATPFANAAGATFTLSIDFLGGLQAATDSGDVMGLGLLTSTNFGWQGLQSDHAFYDVIISLNNVSDQNLTQFRFSRGSPTESGNGGFLNFTPMLTTDNWYRLTATYTNTGSNFSVAISLYDIGATGLSAPSLIRSSSGMAGVPELASASTLYAGIYGGTSGGDTQFAKRLDNFSANIVAVPKPGVAALLALGGVAFGLVRSRRASASALH